MMTFLFIQNKILGDKKISHRTKTDLIGLSKKTKKKIEEQMIRNFIKRARKSGWL